MIYSPLARGNLAVPFDEYETTDRGETDDWAHQYPYRDGRGETIIRRVEELAEEKDAIMAQISLAWLLSKDPVTTPIIGADSVLHLEQVVEATEIELSESDLEWLEEPYEPLQVAGHS